MRARVCVLTNRVVSNLDTSTSALAPAVLGFVGGLHVGGVQTPHPPHQAPDTACPSGSDWAATAAAGHCLYQADVMQSGSRVYPWASMYSAYRGMSIPSSFLQQGCQSKRCYVALGHFCVLCLNKMTCVKQVHTMMTDQVGRTWGTPRHSPVW